MRIIRTLLLVALVFSMTLPAVAQPKKFRVSWKNVVTGKTGDYGWTTENFAVGIATYQNGKKSDVRHWVKMRQRFWRIIPLPAKRIPLAHHASCERTWNLEREAESCYASRSMDSPHTRGCPFFYFSGPYSMGK